MKLHSSRRLFFLALSAAFLLPMTSCHKQPAATISPFPDSAEAPGWSKSPEVRSFAPSELSNYIDGEAERYLKAGVRATSTADYKFQSQLQVVADVYTMYTPDGAKAIFDSEPVMEAQSPSLGDAAHLFSQSLIFRKGSYLVRLVAYQESPQTPQALLGLGQAIDKKLSR
jgi:hypothetical protein